MSKTTNKYAREVRERAVRMVVNHQQDHASRRAAVVSTAAKIGRAAQALHEWVKKAEVDSGRRTGVPSDVAAQLKALERGTRALHQANEILRKASAYFAQDELARSKSDGTARRSALRPYRTDLRDFRCAARGYWSRPRRPIDQHYPLPPPIPVTAASSA